MRKTGRGAAYRNALELNLVRALKNHKRIVTTHTKADKVARAIVKTYGGTVRTYRLGKRRGDAAIETLVVWKEEIHENKTTKIK